MLCVDSAADADSHLCGGNHSLAYLSYHDVGRQLLGVIATGVAAKRELECQGTGGDGVDEQAVFCGKDVGDWPDVVELCFCRRFHEVEVDVEVPLAAQHHVGCVARREDEGGDALLPYRLSHVGTVETLVASRGTDETTRTHEAVEDSAEELCLAKEVLMRTLAEADDAGLAHAVGIAEDVLETKQVRHRSVEVPQGVGHQFLVIGDGIGDEADVSIGRHANIGRVIAAACCCAGSMRTVILQAAVRGAGLAENVFRCRIGFAYRKLHAVGLIFHF